ncbi:MAG: MarR family transcriptional regulator [Actinomycetota bacterium]|nr:MarR family transcriptional regulator [Actinomycetota bacterium]
MTDEQAHAERFAELFRAVYLTFHRRDGPRSQLAGASRAVLEHLALAGPLTVGEAAAHLVRAQSVISEIVAHLERQGLLERDNDPADRRRTLIWLTQRGHEALRRDREVLSVEQLARAMARLPSGQADDLTAGLRALVDLAPPAPPDPPAPFLAASPRPTDPQPTRRSDDRRTSLPELRDADRDRPLLRLLHG